MTSSREGFVPRAVAAGDASQPRHALAPDYEKARARQDSLDHLVEWPAQREMLGDVEGLSILDLGCGNGDKLAQFGNDTLIWPHRDGLIWPRPRHSGAVMTV